MGDLFGFAFYSGIFYPFFSDTNAPGHIEDGAVFGNTVKDGSSEMSIIDKRVPFIETELGSDDGAAFLMSHLHEIEEESRLHFIKRGIPYFVNQKTVDGCKPFQYLVIAAICKRCVQLPQQVFEVDEADAIFVIECVNEIRNGKTGLPTAGRPDKEKRLRFGDVPQ